MPRLLAGGPGLGVSSDNAWIAVAGGGRLSLVDAATRAEAAAAHLPAGEIDVVFASAAGSPRLLAFHRRESATELAAYALPTLELTAQLVLQGLLHPAAAIGDRVLVYSDGGEGARMVVCTPRQLTTEPIGLREPVQLAAEAPEERLLVATRDQFECWDPAARRALFRLNLPAADPRQAGFAAKWRLLWVATSGPAAQIEVYRFSDGRLQLRVDLPGRFVAASGSPDSPRIVVAAREGERPIELCELDLGHKEKRPIPTEGAPPASFCVVEGLVPSVILAGADGKVRYVPLDKATPAAETAAAPDRTRRARIATPPVAVRMQGGKTGRARLFPDAGARPIPAGPADPGAPARAAASSPASWREALLAWGMAVLAQPESAHAAPAATDTTLEALAARLRLSGTPRLALDLLYAAWLRGDGALGVPASTVAHAIASVEGRVPDDEAWSEALAQGVLGSARLVRSRGGRLLLRKAVGRFLDGGSPRVQVVRTDSTVPGDVRVGTFRVDLEGAELYEHTLRLARHLGRDLALIDLDAVRSDAARSDATRSGSVRSGAALLEARVFGLVPLLLASGARPADYLPLLTRMEGDLALLGITGQAPAAIAHLPVMSAP